MKYRKKPVEIEAVQLLWSTWGEMCDHADVGELTNGKPEGCWIDDEHPHGTHEALGGDAKIGMWIPTLEGIMLATEGDWVIRGVADELYPCKNEIFEATYEAVT